MNTQLINREFNGQVITQRDDGYFNATAMCQATGKKWKNYWCLDGTQEFLTELASTLRMPILLGGRNPPPNENAGLGQSVLIERTLNEVGGNSATFVHPQVAIHLAQWCSPKFAVAITGWVLEYLTTGCIGDAPSSRDFAALNARLDTIEKLVSGKSARSPKKAVKKPVPPQLPEDYRQQIEALVKSGKVKVVSTTEVLTELFGKDVRNLSRSEQTLVGSVLADIAIKRRVSTSGVRTYYYLISN